MYCKFDAYMLFTLMYQVQRKLLLRRLKVAILEGPISNGRFRGIGRFLWPIPRNWPFFREIGCFDTLHSDAFSTILVSLE